MRLVVRLDLLYLTKEENISRREGVGEVQDIKCPKQVTKDEARKIDQLLKLAF